MDKHLNIFWNYGKKDVTGSDSIKAEKHINELENNITRGIIVTFSKMSNANKVEFLNRLIEKNPKISNCNLSSQIKYEYEYELQQTSLKEKVQNSQNKYLIGICPNGDVGKDGVQSLSNVCQIIEKEKVNDDYNANPDGVILVKRGKEIISAFVFENKKEKLNANQLKRHFCNYLGIKSEFDKHFILSNYNDFFSMFTKYNKEYIVSDLLEYARFAGCYIPDFRTLNLNEYGSFEDKKRAINQVLGKVLDLVYEDYYNEHPKSYRRIQKGWGNIIDLKDACTYCKMIGLVTDDLENVTLNIKFAPSMSLAKDFYKNKKFSFDSICSDEHAVGFFCFQGQSKYVMETMQEYSNLKDFIEFFRRLPKEDYHYGGRNKIAELLKSMEKSNLKHDKTESEIIGILNNKRPGTLNNEEINFIATLDINYKWPLDKIRTKDMNRFAKEILEIISKYKVFFKYKTSK